MENDNCLDLYPPPPEKGGNLHSYFIFSILMAPCVCLTAVLREAQLELPALEAGESPPGRHLRAGHAWPGLDTLAGGENEVRAGEGLQFTQHFILLRQFLTEQRSKKFSYYF